jgi:hypothetical protein
VSNIGYASGCNTVNVMSGDVVAGQTVGCKERTCQTTTGKKMKRDSGRTWCCGQLSIEDSQIADSMIRNESRRGVSDMSASSRASE